MYGMLNLLLTCIIRICSEAWESARKVKAFQRDLFLRGVKGEEGS